ncbi:MAG: division/cell wall cluster transcriptional repressor MraZ [Alphaproteobacteria bacterium]|nr:division/cell wall cluster transcriptional repressor MraZ [Alphaproteobacteria bacterium]
MPLFLSTYQNKVDKKGRVSVPAAFRAELDKGGFNSFIAFPHPEFQCIEGWDKERMERFAEGMDDFAPMSAEYAAASALMSRSRELVFDPEGRIAIPPAMLDWGGISDAVVFAGRGQSFQLWHPDTFEAYEEEAAKLALENRDKFRLAPRRRPDGEGR